ERISGKRKKRHRTDRRAHQAHAHHPAGERPAAHEILLGVLVPAGEIDPHVRHGEHIRHDDDDIDPRQTHSSAFSMMTSTSCVADNHGEPHRPSLSSGTRVTHTASLPVEYIT